MSARSNKLLACLPTAELEKLAPLLREVPLDAKQIIYHVRSSIDYVYFPTSGVISAMTLMEDGSAIEVATIGNEGMAGLIAVTGIETSPYEVMVQVRGTGFRMEVQAFKQEVAKSSALHDILMRYNVAFSVQVSYSVACNGLHTIEKRCCRWLLMAQDRVGSKELLLTHEFIAIMLGVRRPSVTDLLQALQKKGLINCGRGRIEILDRPGLERMTCECYRRTNEEFERQFG